MQLGAQSAQKLEAPLQVLAPLQQRAREKACTGRRRARADVVEAPTRSPLARVPGPRALLRCQGPAPPWAPPRSPSTQYADALPIGASAAAACPAPLRPKQPSAAAAAPQESRHAAAAPTRSAQQHVRASALMRTLAGVVLGRGPTPVKICFRTGFHFAAYEMMRWMMMVDEVSRKWRIDCCQDC